MRRAYRSWICSCPILLAILLGPLATPAAAQRPDADGPRAKSSPRGEALRPSAAKRVEDNAAAVTARLRELIAASTTPEAEALRDLVNGDSADWGIRYRDGYLLFSIPVRKNLSLREKQDGEGEARGLALVTLTQNFKSLLELKNTAQGLDREAVRVILMEPDARRLSAAGIGFGGSGAYGGYGGSGGAGWLSAASGAMATVGCPCVAAPPPCGCE